MISVKGLTRLYGPVRAIDALERKYPTDQFAPYVLFLAYQYAPNGERRDDLSKKSCTRADTGK